MIHTGLMVGIIGLIRVVLMNYATKYRALIFKADTAQPDSGMWHQHMFSDC